MRRFIKKLAIHGFLLLLSTGAIIIGRYLLDVRQPTLDLASLPTNFVSNSVCFNTKLDHAKTANRLFRARTLVLGSSMALNNVVVPVLARHEQEPVYNLSSWALKPYESFELLKQLDGKLGIRHLIIPFNHTEFGVDAKTIDYDGVRTFFTTDNVWYKVQNYLANFTVDGFVKDWSLRAKYGHDSNANLSLDFDETGTVIQRPRQYIFDKASHRLAYQDTTGFHRFAASIDSIHRFCAARNIKLTLVYLPWRRDVLTATHQRQVDYVSTYLLAQYPNGFIDLSGLSVASRNYIDAGHLFEAGAQVVTWALVDSLAQHPATTGLARFPLNQDRPLATR